MTAVENAAVSQEELDAKAWAGFTEGNWQKIQTSPFTTHITT